MDFKEPMMKFLKEFLKDLRSFDY